MTFTRGPSTPARDERRTRRLLASAKALDRVLRPEDLRAIPACYAEEIKELLARMLARIERARGE